MALNYTLRLRLKGTEIFFGPGVEELMRLVDETGSLHTAAMRMEMSYSKAWKMIRGTERELGYSVLERQAGGSGGGFSRLTDGGRDFLERYVKFREEVEQEADKKFQKYFEDGGINETDQHGGCGGTCAVP